jgi:hypothetical protein
MKFKGLNTGFGGVPTRALQVLPGEPARLAVLGVQSATARP